MNITYHINYILSEWCQIMKIKVQVFFLSLLSTVALTAVTQADFSDSSETKYVRRPSPKWALFMEPGVFPVLPKKNPITKETSQGTERNVANEKQSNEWFHKSGVFPVLEVNNTPHKNREVLQADAELLSIGSVIQVLRSPKDRNESVIISPRGLNHSTNLTDAAELNIGNGASYTGPLTAKERRVKHVLAAVDALPNQDISAIFNVLNRSSIDKHPVYANNILHPLYEVAQFELAKKMKAATGHPWRQRKSIPSRMRPDLGLKDSFSSSIVQPLKNSTRLSALNTSSVFSPRKSASQETISLPENEEETGFFAKNKKRVIRAAKAMTRWVKR